MKITPEQRAILEGKGWGEVVRDMESGGPQKEIGPIPAGIALSSEKKSLVVGALTTAHRGVLVDSEENTPLLHLRGSASAMLGALLDPRVLSPRESLRLHQQTAELALS